MFGDIGPVGLGDNHEARGHREAGARQLTEVGALAARLVDVVAANFVKLFDEDH